MRGYWLDFYLIGVIIEFIIVLRDTYKSYDETIRLSNIFSSLCIAVFSWVAVALHVIDKFGDVVLYKKEKK